MAAGTPCGAWPDKRCYMAQIKAVFFDAAGTLFETREPVGESYARFARANGVETSAWDVDAAFRRTFRDTPPLAFGLAHKPEELRHLERDWWREVVKRTFSGLGEFSDFEAFFDSLFAFFADPARWVADPEGPPTLRILRERGLMLGIISNFDYRLYGILDGIALRHWFDSITISSEVGYAKPSERMFEMALARHQLAPGEAIHVGDSEHLDVAGATAAGVGAVLIDRHRRKRIEFADRIARVSTLSAIVDAVSFFDAW